MAGFGSLQEDVGTEVKDDKKPKVKFPGSDDNVGVECFIDTLLRHPCTLDSLEMHINELYSIKNSLSNLEVNKQGLMPAERQRSALAWHMHVFDI
jgi:hypothetical protein